MSVYYNITDLENQIINCNVASVAPRLRGFRLGNSLQDQLKMKNCVSNSEISWEDNTVPSYGRSAAGYASEASSSVTIRFL
jgi:hypothetical protein